MSTIVTLAGVGERSIAGDQCRGVASVNSALVPGLLLVTAVTCAAAVVSALTRRWLAWAVNDPSDMNALPGWVTRGPRSHLVTLSALLPAVIAGLAALRVLGSEPATWPLALLWAGLAGVTPWLIAVDHFTHRLPNRIVLPLGALGLVCTAAAFALQATAGEQRHCGAWGVCGSPALSGLVGAAILVGLFAALNALAWAMRTRGMGLGDVKLALPLGMLAGGVGPWTVLVLLILANLTALSEAVISRRSRAGTGQTDIAFGPHLLVGCWVAVLVASVVL